MTHGRTSQRYLMQLAAVITMVFALVWPSVAPAVAQTVLSPAQLLAQDLAQSLCAEKQGGGDKAPGHSGKACDLCVLCRTLATAIVLQQDAGEPDVAPVAQHMALAFGLWQAPSAHPLDTETGPPRAPPTSL